MINMRLIKKISHTLLRKRLVKRQQNELDFGEMKRRGVVEVAEYKERSQDPLICLLIDREEAVYVGEPEFVNGRPE
jgi:hypothetical protein